MNFLQRLRFLIFGTPYVVVTDRVFKSLHVKPVHIMSGSAYIITRGDRKRLLPRGAIYPNDIFVDEWSPATPDMNLYFNPPAE